MYLDSTRVTATADPDPDYIFDYWSGLSIFANDMSSTAKVNMTRDVHLIAHFLPDPFKPDLPQPPTPPDGNPPGDGGDMPVPASCDPNDKQGPAGMGGEHYLTPGSIMPYSVFYENDAEKATAPALLVEVEDYLSPDLDWSTFELGDINLYADFWVDVPDGLQHWEYTVDLRPEGKELLVDILADFDSDTGLAYWSFQSIDPETLEEPLDPFAGFLSHLNENNANDGSVSYVVYGMEGLATGTVIENFAVSTFDHFSSDTTPTVFNTIDSGTPVGNVNSLPALLPDEPFTVFWSGEDDEGGSGIATYTVYVKRDEEEWQVWLQNTADTSAEFSGVGGHRYAFRAVAKDHVGLVEVDSGEEEAFTEVDFSQLRVDHLQTTTSGFVAYFKRAIDESVLNLYNVEADTFGTADFTVVGDIVGAVPGSLDYDAIAKTVTFIKTGGPLAADTYSITLRSAVDGFKDSEGHLLDGDGDDIEGGDYVTTATVQATTARMFSIPDFTRGPGQPVDIPADDSGLPITIDDADGLEAVDLTLFFDPELLVITDAVLGPDAPAGSVVVGNFSIPGQVVLTFYSQTPLDAGQAEIITLSAEVPSEATYGASQIIEFAAVDINEGAILAAGDNAIHITAFFGDTTGNQAYNGLDAQRTARVVVGLDTGFAAYPLIDPIVIADITGNGSMSGLDANRIAQETVGLDQVEIPPLPVSMSMAAVLASTTTATVPTDDTSQAFVSMSKMPEYASVINDASSTMSVNIPTDLSGLVGQTVTVPVNIQDADGVESVDMRIAYDAALLTVSNTSAVEAGSVWSVGDATVVVNLNQATGQIIATIYSPIALDSGTGSLFDIGFMITSDTGPNGTTVIDLQQIDLNEDLIPVDPDPMVGDDPTDGLLTILTASFPNRIDVVLVCEPAPSDQDSGEIDALPASEEWIEEWNSFYVEIWVSTLDTTDIGIESARVDLTFNPNYVTVTSIEYGPAFDQSQTAMIDNETGYIDNLGAATLRLDVGDDRHVLLARVRFAPTESDSGVDLEINVIIRSRLTMASASAMPELSPSAAHH